MRKVVFESSVSRDGFIEGPNGELDWLVFDDDKQFDARRFLAAFDTVFYGRKTYERMAVPHGSGAELTEAERYFFYALYGMRKYVFSRTKKHVEGNAMVVSENLEAEVCRIRSEKGKDIWFCGGAEILASFRALDLVDEYLITVHPVNLHSGKPLFPERTRPLDLKLIKKQNLASGVSVLHYRPESRLKMYSHGRSV